MLPTLALPRGPLAWHRMKPEYAAAALRDPARAASKNRVARVMLRRSCVDPDLVLEDIDDTAPRGTPAQTTAKVRPPLPPREPPSSLDPTATRLTLVLNFSESVHAMLHVFGRERNDENV